MAVRCFGIIGFHTRTHIGMTETSHEVWFIARFFRMYQSTGYTQRNSCKNGKKDEIPMTNG
uniref:Uncharacterized protein n=1 Tax=Phaeodactylum tricornutum TaxID=2850 RepID=A0A8J9SB12_PHATR